MEATIKEIALTAAANVVSRPGLILDLQSQALKLKISIAKDRERLSDIEAAMNAEIAFDAGLKNAEQRKAALEQMKRSDGDAIDLRSEIGGAEDDLSGLEIRIQHLKDLQRADLALIAFATALHS